LGPDTFALCRFQSLTCGSDLTGQARQAFATIGNCAENCGQACVLCPLCRLRIGPRPMRGLEVRRQPFRGVLRFLSFRLEVCGSGLELVRVITRSM
jgi:hypothetical protein